MRCLPELAGRLDGVALRVPVVNGSLVDLGVLLAREVTAEEVNAAFALPRPMARWPDGCATRPSPSSRRDVIGDPASCVFDSGLTQASGRFVKVFGWYDNEWGYTCRLADLTQLVADDERAAGPQRARSRRGQTGATAAHPVRPRAAERDRAVPAVRPGARARTAGLLRQPVGLRSALRRSSWHWRAASTASSCRSAWPRSSTGSTPARCRSCSS